MDTKMLFLNTGWMDFYQGLKNDNISGGGKHVSDHGWGGEMFNFQPFQGHCYGYVQPFIDKKYHNPSVIKIEKLGASEADDKIGNITVVWTARDPRTGGTYIVGWYKNATVYRELQDPPANSKRYHKKEPLGYYVTTKLKDAVRLPVDKRTIRIQRQKKNWMGQSNVWYAEKQPGFLKSVEDYIFRGIIPGQIKYFSKKKGTPRQVDPLKRLQVEKKAIRFVTNYYEKLGYKIDSVEKDNVGWDLTATNKKTELRLEVKGLSGKIFTAELTPNEYEYLKNDKRFYRLCIVTNSLFRPKLKIFAYSTDLNKWCSDDGKLLQIDPVLSARVSCTD